MSRTQATTYVKITVLTVYGTANNGAEEVAFFGPAGAKFVGEGTWMCCGVQPKVLVRLHA